MLNAGLKALVLSAPRKLVTLVVVFSGILSNAASEAGYVILIPLAGVIFLAFGRHPLAGMAAAFAGVSGGYSANLVLGTVDPLLAGITEEMAKIVDPSYKVNPAANYFFMIASTFLLTALGTWIIEAIVEPRLGKYNGEEAAGSMESLKPEERRGLKIAGLAALVCFVLLWIAVIPEGGVLRDPKTGDILHSPFLSGIVAIIFFVFFILGLAYGIATRSLKNDADVVNSMGKAMSTLGVYIVLVFFAAQFVAFFSWTNLGIITAIKGVEFLKTIGFTGIPLIVSFVFLTAIMNLFMGSASASGTGLARGKVLFRAYCQACHGEKGTGAPATKTKMAELAPTIEDKVLKEFVSGGQLNLRMQAFGKTLTSDQLDDVIAYVRSWQTSAA